MISETNHIPIPTAKNKPASLNLPMVPSPDKRSSMQEKESATDTRSKTVSIPRNVNTEYAIHSTKTITLKITVVFESFKLSDISSFPLNI